MRTYRLAVIGGDGIGPEVTTQALKAVHAAGERFAFCADITQYQLGAARYLATGELLPDSVEDELRTHDAILLGAVGSPEVPPGVLERGLLLRLRFRFDLYVNLRPVKLLPNARSPISGLSDDPCDLVVVRENTEGPYSGAGGTVHRDLPAEVALQESVNTRFAVERILRYSFDLARDRRRHLTLCHKTNVLLHAGGLWQRVFDKIAPEFPDVATDYVHADAACLYLITNPHRFDVLVTDNLFGDIVTDVGAAIAGGLGLAASGNLNPARTAPSMFEPVHGSAPDIAGRGWANPAGAVLSAAMCLHHLGEAEAASAIEHAVAQVLPELRSMGGPDMGMTTGEVGDRITSCIAG